MISTAVSDELIIHTAVKDTDLPQITEAMQNWYSNPDFDADRPVLWDFRTAEFSTPSEDVDAWSDSNSAMVNALRAGRKTALVFDNPAVADYAVELLGAHDWQHRVRIFNSDMEAALAWVRSTIR